MLFISKLKRIYIPDGIYFVTIVTHNRIPFFKDSHLANIVISRLQITKNIQPYYLYAYVVMHDHAHFLLRPRYESNISDLMHCLKRNISRSINIIYPHLIAEDDHPRLSTKFIWQKSFYDHIIRDQQDLNHHVNYIHYNPVRDGLVNKPEDWPWSSYKDFVNANYSLIDSIPY
ncbi:MAG: transposase [Candidatus Nomurabacteria bacterium]|nr:MAG: transposase [Candidatus Nomurabacteria bacterium]